MKKIIAFFLICYLICCLTVTASCFSVEFNKYGDVIYTFKSGLTTSKDRKYEFKKIEGSNSIILFSCFQKNITVLEIPDKIDGYEVVGMADLAVNSTCLTKIIFPNTYMFSNEFDIYNKNSSPDTPLCNIILSKGIKAMNNSLKSTENGYYIVDSKLLIIPSSMTKINCRSLGRDKFENIVILGNPTICDTAFTICDYDNFENTRVDYKGNRVDSTKTPCNIYYEGDCTNSSPSAFDYDVHIDLNEADEPTQYPGEYVTIYKKPGADGFERFQGENYQAYLLNESSGSGNWQLWNGEMGYVLPQGYTVKEYTDEWWKDIKEIESVTLSGKGLTENETVTQKLSESELKWMDKEYSLEMSSGEKVKLNSTFAPSDAFDDRMFFVSLNEDVAKVDVDSGEITAIKKGAATVRCVAASGVFSDVVIYVDGATAADLPDTTTPAAAATDISTNAASSASTASTPAPKATKISEPAKGSKVKPVYIAVPAAAVVILASAVVMIKKKKK